MIDEAVVVSETDVYAHPLMNELLEAITLPAVSKVPPSWKPPKPTFMLHAALDADELQDLPIEPKTSEATSEGGIAGTSAPNVHTAYGTASQWTNNVDHVMSGICMWLNGDEGDKRAYYRANAEDRVFLQQAIGDYLKTLSINLDPKAALYAAIFVVWCGHIGNGLVYRGRQLFTYGRKWWTERKEKQQEAAKAARAEALRKRRLDAIMDALHNPDTGPREADALAKEAMDIANDGVIAVEAEEIGNDAHPYLDPDFRPRPTAAEAIKREELKFRKSNGYCLLPNCDKKLTGRNKSFCCADHRNQYMDLDVANPELPTLNELPSLLD